MLRILPLRRVHIHPSVIVALWTVSACAGAWSYAVCAVGISATLNSRDPHVRAGVAGGAVEAGAARQRRTPAVAKDRAAANGAESPDAASLANGSGHELAPDAGHGAPNTGCAERGVGRI